MNNKKPDDKDDRESRVQGYAVRPKEEPKRADKPPRTGKINLDYKRPTKD